MASRGTGRYFYLRGDEQVLLRLRPEKEWALAGFLVVALVATTLQVVALALVPDELPRARTIVFAVYGALLLLGALIAWRRWATTEYALTETRIYARHGQLRTRVHFTTHDRVTDMRYRQGPLDRLFGISGISFATAGGDVHVVGIRDAIAFKEAAERAREDLLQRLLERAGAEAAARAPAAPQAEAPGEERAPAPRAPTAPLPAPWTGPRPPYLKAGDVPLWHGKPRLVAALSAAIPLAGALPFLIVVMLSRGGAGSALVPLVVLVVLAGALGLRLAQLTRTEYTVTNQRVYARSGIVGTTVTQLTYDKITDITYRQDILGRVLGYGGVTVNTAGSNQAPVQMVGLARPLETQALIEAARSRYLKEEPEA